MKKTVIIFSIISLIFITGFFIVQVAVINKGMIMSGNIQTFFGIGLLIISICIIAFLAIIIFRNMNIPSFIEVNLFEIMVVVIIMIIVAMFLLFKK